jgi:hypothetical protein
MRKLRIAFLVCCFVLSVASFSKAQEQVEAKELAGIVAITNVGTPVPDMLVELYNKGWRKRIAVTKTDANGFFRFPHRSEGKYYLRTSKAGFSSDKVIVMISKKSKEPLALITEGISNQ